MKSMPMKLPPSITKKNKSEWRRKKRLGRLNVTKEIVSVKVVETRGTSAVESNNVVEIAEMIASRRLESSLALSLPNSPAPKKTCLRATMSPTLSLRKNPTVK